MKRLSFLLIMAISSIYSEAQDLPFHEMSEPAESYSATSVLARYIDGLGFRLYWATEGLNSSDYDYRPSAEVRTIRETMEHIYGLCIAIERTLENQGITAPEAISEISGQELREAMLSSLQKSKNLLNENPDLKSQDMVFGSGDQEYRLPFWNLINGPMADAMYHTGQVVAFRRAAGNPIASGVNVLTGKKSE